jgi:hypothetical protein
MSKSKPKKKAWEWFSKYIRLRDALNTTGTKDSCRCITCGRIYPSFGVGCIQAGHFISGRNNSVLIDEKFVFGQCYHCNVGLKGNWVPYRRKMIELYGEEEVKKVEDRQGKTLPMKAYQWEELAELYKQKYQDLL